MASMDALRNPSEERDDASLRLDAALTEQGHRRDEHRAALDTPGELKAYARLCEANEQVAARDLWLNWLDDNAY